MENNFPKIKKSIQDFFEDEDGSITRNKVLMIGGMVLVLGILLSEDVFAAHRSHSTHRSHSSHRSSNSKHGSHSSHSSSHSTHSNHATHGTHSSHASHISYTESKNYGSTTTKSGEAWPSLNSIQSIETPAAANIVDTKFASVLNSINTPESGSELLKIGEEISDIQMPPNTPDLTYNKG